MAMGTVASKEAASGEARAAAACCLFHKRLMCLLVAPLGAPLVSCARGGYNVEDTLPRCNFGMCTGRPAHCALECHAPRLCQIPGWSPLAEDTSLSSLRPASAFLDSIEVCSPHARVDLCMSPRAGTGVLHCILPENLRICQSIRTLGSKDPLAGGRLWTIQLDLARMPHASPNALVHPL